MQTTVTTEQEARAPAGSATRPAARVGWSSPRWWLQQQLPRLVLSPTVLITLVFVYGFILWTLYLSFTRSRGIPSHELVGWLNYQRVWNHPRWSVALHNLAVFGILYIALCLVLGLLIAILLDQRIRQEGVLRAIYLYPMALSFIIPQLRPVFLSAVVILAHLAIKSYELVVALTGGGPGYATEMPSTFMYAHTFTRSQLGWGAASATMMLLTVAAIMVPYLYSEVRTVRSRRQ